MPHDCLKLSHTTRYRCSQRVHAQEIWPFMHDFGYADSFAKL